MKEITQQLIEQLREALAALEPVQTSNKAFRQALRDAKPRTRQALESGHSFQQQAEQHLAELETKVTNAVSLAASLVDARAAADTVNTIKTGDLVGNFRSVIDSIQRQARDPEQGEAGVTLQSLDVDVRGFIALEQNEARIITPTLNRTEEAGQLSTIRLVFGTIPVVQAEQESPPVIM
ncbi:MAG: hypothetical protein JNK38_22080 [Acidobacteria bacterium]|nr:hypothetical protein [Acidobacteriota bacterium]